MLQCVAMIPEPNYGPIAGAYNRVMASRIFAAPARDLVGILKLRDSRSVLDVGTGTGLVARAAVEAVGTRGLVVGLDPSFEMLRYARASGLPLLLAASVPGVPFAERFFDIVLAGFVVSHFRNVQEALLDLVRVLKPGGRLGATAWRISEDDYSRAWNDAAGSFVNLDRLGEAVREAIPWEERFSDPAHLRAAFEEAGLGRVEIEQREYRISVSVDEYHLIQENRAAGTIMQGMLGPPSWNRFREQVADVFRNRFRSPIEYTRTAWFAVGTKPVRASL